MIFAPIYRISHLVNIGLLFSSTSTYSFFLTSSNFNTDIYLLNIYIYSDSMTGPRSKTTDNTQDNNAEVQPERRGRSSKGQTRSKNSALRPTLAAITSPTNSTNNTRQGVAGDSLEAEFEETMEQRVEALQREFIHFLMY